MFRGGAARPAATGHVESHTPPELAYGPAPDHVFAGGGIRPSTSALSTGRARVDGASAALRAGDRAQPRQRREARRGRCRQRLRVAMVTCMPSTPRPGDLRGRFSRGARRLVAHLSWTPCDRRRPRLDDCWRWMRNWAIYVTRALKRSISWPLPMAVRPTWAPWNHRGGGGWHHYTTWVAGCTRESGPDS